jgi:hypothetical protein
MKFIKAISRLYIRSLILLNRLDEMLILVMRPLLWSSGQCSWLQIQRSWVRFPALPDFLRISRSGTGFTEPRESN